MKKIIAITLGGALCIASLLVMNHMSKPKPHPMDKPLAEWLRMEVSPKSAMREMFMYSCMDAIVSPTDKDVEQCHKLANEHYPTIPLEIYLTREDKE